jgi:hypothetical protein
LFTVFGARAHPPSRNDRGSQHNEGGIAALVRDKTRLPGKQPISNEIKNEVCSVVCNEKPESGTHWSTRELGKRFGISHASVNTLLREKRLKLIGIDNAVWLDFIGYNRQQLFPACKNANAT